MRRGDCVAGVVRRKQDSRNNAAKDSVTSAVDSKIKGAADSAIDAMNGAMNSAVDAVSGSLFSSDLSGADTTLE